MKRPGFPRDSIATINDKLRAAAPISLSPAPLTLSPSDIAEIERKFGVKPRAARRIVAVPA